MPRNLVRIIASIAVAFGAALALAAPGDDDALTPQALRAKKTALASEQFNLVKQAEANLDVLYKKGALSLYDPRITLWARRKVEATRSLGTGKAEMIAVIEEYLERAKTYEDAITKAFNANHATQLEIQDVRFLRLEAEIWLNEERAKAP